MTSLIASCARPRRTALLCTALAVTFASAAATAQLLPIRPATPVNKTLTVRPAAAPSAGWSSEPKWPLQFQLIAGERSSAAFAVTQPGPVRITVQASGAPLIVTLRRPGGRIVERSGTGTLLIEDNAEPADVAAGMFWSVGWRAAKETSRVAVAPVRAGAAVRAVAGGTVTVEHPPVDAARADAAYKALQPQADTLAQRAQQQGPAPDLGMVARQAQARYELETAQLHATQLAALSPRLPAEVTSQMNQQINLQLQGQSLAQAQANAPLRLITAVPLAVTGKTLVQRPPLLGGGTSTSQSAATGVTPVGSTSGAATVAVGPPQLAALSIAEGDAGAPITLTGTDMGDAPGAVHFIVGNGRDVIASSVTYWSGTQIVAAVPYADGVPVYDGYVYVQRPDGAKSTLRPFRYIPPYEFTSIGLPMGDAGYLGVPFYFKQGSMFDSQTPPGGADVRYSAGSLGYITTRSAMFWGSDGYDEFYITSRLKNGWLVHEATLGNGFGPWQAGPTIDPPGKAGAYITDVRPGTDQPYVKIRWWVDGGNNTLEYRLRVTVKRPKGLACAADPCPVF